MSKSCKPEDIALKSLFLGPQSENAIWLKASIDELFTRWFEWRQGRFVEDGRAISPQDQASPEFKKSRKQMTSVLGELSARFEEEVPKYSPRYIGHMFSEVALPAMLGHVAALLHNPNIISGESARVGVVIEDEAISSLCEMIGYDVTHAAGHFTSGGTVANFEAVVRARGRAATWMAAGAAAAEINKTKPDPCRDAVMGWQAFDDLSRDMSDRDQMWSERIDSWNFEKIGFLAFARRLDEEFSVVVGHPVMLVPSHKHYSWPKASKLFGFGDETMKLVHLDAAGRLDVNHLRQRLKQAFDHRHPVMMVVSLVGTTELGVVDPVEQVTAVSREFGAVWHHMDASYGGFLAAMNRGVGSKLSKNLVAAIDGFKSVSSVTIDPHKFGYVPYSAGVFMTAERRDYDLRAIEAPYIQHAETDRGSFTLEGSRPATGAAATWMLARTLGFTPTGLGRVIDRNFDARNLLADELQKIKIPVRIVQTIASNVLCFVLAREGESLSTVNARTRMLYENLSRPDSKFVVSKTTITWQHYGDLCERFTGSWGAYADVREVVLIRMCLMNPFFTSKEMSLSYPEAFAHEVEMVAMSN